MRDLVREQREVRPALTRAEVDVAAERERARAEVRGGSRRRLAGVHPNGRQLGTERPRQRRGHGGGERFAGTG